MATGWPKLDEGGVEALSAWLRERPDARLVAVDTLAKIRPRTRGQNVYQEDYAALEELLPLAAEHRVAIVVVHHTRKMAAADPLDEITLSIREFAVINWERGLRAVFTDAPFSELEHGGLTIPTGQK